MAEVETCQGMVVSQEDGSFTLEVRFGSWSVPSLVLRKLLGMDRGNGSASDLFGPIGVIPRLFCRFGIHGEFSCDPNGGLNECMRCEAQFDGQPGAPRRMVHPTTMTICGANNREMYRREWPKHDYPGRWRA